MEINKHNNETNLKELPKIWEPIQKDYKLLECLGSGTWGSVIKAQHRQSKQIVAIKYMKDIFEDSYRARKMLREIIILRKFTDMQNNIFTTKLIDIILPQDNLSEQVEDEKEMDLQQVKRKVIVNKTSTWSTSEQVDNNLSNTEKVSNQEIKHKINSQNDVLKVSDDELPQNEKMPYIQLAKKKTLELNNLEINEEQEDLKIDEQSNEKTVTNDGSEIAGNSTKLDSNVEREINLQSTNFNHMFLIMEFVETDFKKLLSATPSTQVDEDHIITILYNMLCAINYIHSANILHRDLKPANFLINSNCNIKICDFGLSRVLPSQNQVEKELVQLKKDQFKVINKMRSKTDIVNEGNSRLLRLSKEAEFRQQIAQRLTENKDARAKQKRELSSFVSTRWYRSPEVVLIEKNYNQATDIWSLGTVLAELLFCSTKYKDNEAYNQDNRFLFKGSSCYPLSPHFDKKDGQNSTKSMDTSAYDKDVPDQQISISSNDQQSRICSRYPSLSENIDFCFITDPEVLRYQQQIFDYSKELNQISQQKRNKNDQYLGRDIPIKELFHKSNSELVNILQEMLQFNPYFRPRAKDLLKNRIFDHIRIPENEQQSPYKIVINVDKNDYKFDYEKEVYNGKVGQEQDIIQHFKHLIIKEVYKHKNQMAKDADSK